ncbi:unnamed protein product [Ascophyllum nodosum]
MAGGADLLALSDLLRGGKRGEEEKRWQTDKAREKPFTPGDFGPPTAIAENTPQSRRASDSKAIWGEDEAVQNEDPFYDPEDKRPQPWYDIVYKQSVMTEDTFLGMAGKTPGSQDCTHIVVKVVFPACRMCDLEVEVIGQNFLAASPNLRLATYLPFPVDEAKGVAEWDAASETLSVTLPIIMDIW